MTAKTNAERGKALKDRRKAAGLKRVEYWAHPDDEAELSRFVQAINAKQYCFHLTKLTQQKSTGI